MSRLVGVGRRLRWRVLATSASLLCGLALLTTSTADLASSVRVREAQARSVSVSLRPIKGLAYDPHDSERVWAILEGDTAVYRSDDGAGGVYGLLPRPQGRLRGPEDHRDPRVEPLQCSSA